MASFRTRMRKAARDYGPIILACDYPSSATGLKRRTVRIIRELDGLICGIKLNFHLLLPLGRSEIREIVATASGRGMAVIADIKLNDIVDTNATAAEHLWDAGFDAVIANPIMGRNSLGRLVDEAHADSRGVIALCHMSAPEARTSYEQRLAGSPSRLYKLFLKWSVEKKADGLVVGATYPEIIRHCAARSSNMLDIYSPGVGVQGGSPDKTIQAGARYIIVGRSIMQADKPALEARRMLGML